MAEYLNDDEFTVLGKSGIINGLYYETSIGNNARQGRTETFLHELGHANKLGHWGDFPPDFNLMYPSTRTYGDTSPLILNKAQACTFKNSACTWTPYHLGINYPSPAQKDYAGNGWLEGGEKVRQDAGKEYFPNDEECEIFSVFDFNDAAPYPHNNGNHGTACDDDPIIVPPFPSYDRTQTHCYIEGVRDTTKRAVLEQPCNNGIFDRGHEECEIGADESFCKPNEQCNTQCLCEEGSRKKSIPPSVSGHATTGTTGSIQCTRKPGQTGYCPIEWECPEGYFCTGNLPNCRCTEICGDEQVKGKEECDPPGDQCTTTSGTNGICTSQCTCKEQIPLCACSIPNPDVDYCMTQASESACLSKGFCGKTEYSDTGGAYTQVYPCTWS